MFFVLLIVTLGTSLGTAGIVVRLFRRPIRQILDRIIGEEIAEGWQKFLIFALFVVGVSSGVQIWKLEQYLQPQGPDPRVHTQLTGAAIALEIYRTMIQVLQGLAWALLLFFVIALVAFAIIRRTEPRPVGTPHSGNPPS